MATGIPGLDVAEFDELGRPRGRSLVPVPGTGRTGYVPNFTMPGPQPPKPTLGQGLRRMMANAGDTARSFGQSVGDVLKRAPSNVVNAVEKAGLARRAANGLGRLGVAGAAPTAAVAGLTTDTEQYAKRFGLENTQPGLLRDVGVRTLGVASDLGNALTFGLAGEFYRDKQEQAAASAPRPAAALAAPNPAMLPGQPARSRLNDGSIVLAKPDADGRAQGIIRSSNPVAAGIEPGVTVGDRGDAMTALEREQRASAINAESVQIAQGLQGGPTPGVVTGFGDGGRAERNARFDREVAASRLESASRLGGSSRERAAAASALGDFYEGDNRRAIAADQTAATRAIENQRNAATLRGQDVVAATARRNQDLDYAASVYGTDGRNAIAATQLQAAQIDKADQRAVDRRAFTRKLLEDSNRLPDGKVDEKAVAAAMVRLDEITAGGAQPGFTELPNGRQAQAVNEARAALRINQQPEQGFFDELINGKRPRREGEVQPTGPVERLRLGKAAVRLGQERGDLVTMDADGNPIVLKAGTYNDKDRKRLEALARGQ